MKLDIERLENVKNCGDHIIARCPACAAEGRDQKGDHLFINDDGRFGCVVYPNTEGKDHRKKIFDLVGIHEKQGPLIIKVNRPNIPTIPIVIQRNILGTLGTRKIDLSCS